MCVNPDNLKNNKVTDKGHISIKGISVSDKWNSIFIGY